MEGGPVATLSGKSGKNVVPEGSNGWYRIYSKRGITA